MIKIYGDSNSGNCLKVKWVCDRLALPYSWIEMNTMRGDTRRPEFLKLNGAGQVPTVLLDDGRALAQSNAIIRHPPPAAAILFPRMVMTWRKWMNGCSGNRTATSPSSRCAASRWSISASRCPISILTSSSAVMSRWRGWSSNSRRRGSYAGERFSLADVSLLAYTRVAHEGGFSPRRLCRGATLDR